MRAKLLITNNYMKLAPSLSAVRSVGPSVHCSVSPLQQRVIVVDAAIVGVHLRLFVLEGLGVFIFTRLHAIRSFVRTEPSSFIDMVLHFGQRRQSGSFSRAGHASVH